MGLGCKDIMPKMKTQMEEKRDSNMETLFLGV